MRGSEPRKRPRWKRCGRRCNSSGYLPVLSRLLVLRASFRLPSPPVLHCESIKRSRLYPNRVTASCTVDTLPPCPPSPFLGRAGQPGGNGVTPPFGSAQGTKRGTRCPVLSCRPETGTTRETFRTKQCSGPGCWHEGQVREIFKDNSI